jgi:hypothetical protein
MPVTVNGQALSRDLVWNVRTIGDRLATAGRRGSNVEANRIDGTGWRADKPLAELLVTLSMWLSGSDPDGEFPADPTLRARMRKRLDQLLALMGQQDDLAEIVDTETGRRCFAEIQGVLTPSTMAAGARAEVMVPLVIPAGCWEDVAEFDTGDLVLTANTNVVVPAGGSNLPTVGLRIDITPPAGTIRIETAAGRYVEVSGNLPAGAATRIDLNPWDPAAYQLSAPGVSLLAAVTIPDVVALPLPGAAADPALTVTAVGTSAASRIRVRGRRRWQTA